MPRPCADGEHPARPRGEVDAVPGPVAHPGAQQAGDDDHRHQVQRQRAEAQPERLVGGAERDDGLPPADVDEAVGDRRDHVRGQQRDRDQRQVAVQGLGDEARQPAAGPAAQGEHAQRGAGGQGDQQHQPGAPVEVPQQGVVAHAAVPSSGWVSGQAPTVRTVPSAATSRASTPCRTSQSGARSPRTTAAVEAVLAATQVAPVAVTVRHTPATGWPVRGSSRWWRRTPCRRPAPHLRAGGGQAAAVERDQGLDRVAGALGDRDRPRRLQRPAVGAGEREVAADADHRRPGEPGGEARRDQVGRPGLAGRAQVQRGAGRDPERPVGVEAHLAPGVRARRGDRGGRGDRSRRLVVGALGEPGVVPVVAELHQRPAEQRVHQPVGGPGGAERGADRGDQQRVHADPAAGLPVDPAQVGVGAEPAAHLVDVAQDVLGEPAGRAQVGADVHADVDAAAQRGEGGRGRHLSHLPRSRCSAPGRAPAAAEVVAAGARPPVPARVRARREGPRPRAPARTGRSRCPRRRSGWSRSWRGRSGW